MAGCWLLALPNRQRPTANDQPPPAKIRSVSNLARQAEAIRWYHTIDLGGGVVTKGIDETPVRLARLDLPASLAGLSVLDIGAWDGFFSFEAERRGAARVLAADYYSWHGDGWGSKAGFELARRTFGSSRTGSASRRQCA